MNTINVLFIPLIILALTACSSSIKKSPYFGSFNTEKELSNLPKLNEETTKNAGERMLETQINTKIPTIILDETIQLSGNIKLTDYNLFVQPGEYEYKGTYLDKTLYAAIVRSDKGKMYNGAIIIPKGNSLPMSLYFEKDSRRYMIPGEKRYKFTKSFIIDSQSTDFERTLIYTGRTGDIVNVVYKEFQDNMIRPAFSENFTFDLSSEKTFGIKGALIKVHKFNNQSITYTVLKHFSN